MRNEMPDYCFHKGRLESASFVQNVIMLLSESSVLWSDSLREFLDRSARLTASLLGRVLLLLDRMAWGTGWYADGLATRSLASHLAELGQVRFQWADEPAVFCVLGAK